MQPSIRSIVSDETASSKYKYMHQVLIAAQILGLSSVALLIGISDINSVADASMKSSSCRAFPCLVLSRDTRNPKNRFNNPIYKLTAYRSRSTGQTFRLNAVSGRAFTQNRNRYQTQTHAPLPDGSYSVAARVEQGTIPEVGGTMIPIFPKPGFSSRMTRSALGIHWDPSFDRDRKEDGTSGCVGLTTRQDYRRVRDFVLAYHPRSLEVRIDR
jgi:hypothetical protein